MFKYSALTAVLFISFAFAKDASQASKSVLANIYADQLIAQFDQELKVDGMFYKNSHPLLSETYAKLLAAREYIKNSGEGFISYGTKSLTQVIDAKAYANVVFEINQSAKQVQLIQETINKNKSHDLVHYPSFGASGNITGNTFPTNVWSLTYDDGPHKTRTNEVVDELYRAGVKGTFFVLLPLARRNPKVMDAMIAANMEVAHHTYHHFNLTKVSDEVLEYEVKGSLEELKDEFNLNVSLFRVPFGAGTRDTKVRQKIIDANLIHIFWNVDTLDWKDKDPQSIFQRAKLQMERTPNKSGIILFHDIHSQSVKASKLVLDYLIAEDKTICSVGEVIKWFNNVPQSCL